ncbi:MAG TPA: patatin-like phospholipase family protein [Anseongella sp.]|nr:patatin-like phospholipase family protein [Anseongella sp.]
MKTRIAKLVSGVFGKKSPGISLVLSGGGARGWAHIGLLQALDEAGIAVEAISGVSAGSIVAALYAGGKSPQEILAIVKKADMFKIVRKGLLAFLPGAFSSLGYLEQQLKAFLPEDSFEALGKKVFITAVNLNSGRVEIFSSGELHRPIMASCAIPLVFAPVRIGNFLYSDGGLLNNLPVEPLLDKGYKVIGSNVVSPGLNMGINGIVSVSMRSFELIAYKGIEDKARACDICLTYEGLEKFHVFKFTSAEQIVELGYREAKKQMSEIERAVLSGKM